MLEGLPKHLQDHIDHASWLAKYCSDDADFVEHWDHVAIYFEGQLNHPYLAHLIREKARFVIYRSGKNTPKR